MKRVQQEALSPMDLAMRYLTAKDRTVSEMQTYLDGKEFGEADVDAAIERLKALGLLDDARYAMRFVETRLASKPVSKRHLWEQLKSHGLDDDLINAALDTVEADDEADNAKKVAEKYWRQMQALPIEDRRERVFKRLLSRGFSYDVSRKALQATEEEAWSES